MVQNDSKDKKCNNSIAFKATLQLCLVEIELLQESNTGKDIL